MAEIIVKEVTTRQELMEFVRLPMQIYKKHPNFVPPLINEELSIWDQAKNPALKYSEAKKYIAFKEGKAVGRIAVIINHKEAEELSVKKVRFGWLDFVEDLSVCKALIQKAVDFAKEHQMPYIEGPMGFTNLDKAGMLTMGFDRLATMIGLYNFPYYPEMLQQLGLKKDKEWVEYEIMFPEVLPEKVEKFSELIKEKYNLKVLKFKSKDELLPLVEPMFRLLDETYKNLSTYTPITDEQIKTYKEQYFDFINKDFVVCIEDQNQQLISFAITMPSYSRALQKANGRLFPFGWWHFLQAGRKNNRANFYLIGIHPEYQRRGITAVIFKEIYENFRKKGVKYLETNPELEENRNIQLLWQDYNPVNHKRRCTFGIETGEWKYST
mgnify:CR=1 FL=1